MRTIFTTSFGSLIILLLFGWTITSCSKNDLADSTSLGEEKTQLSMKVNGEDWQSSLTTLLTEQQENTQGEIYFYLYISAHSIIDTNSATEEDLVETMGLYVAIPAQKFKDPKGVYPLVLKEFEVGTAWGIFNSDRALRATTTYVSGDANHPDKQVGTLEITSAEVGEQTVFGYPTGVEGYTKLSGTFSFDVYPLDGIGAKLNMTEGKFTITEVFEFNL